MPSKSTGKTIQKIKINKKNVIISFTDKSKLTCVSDVLANFYLYEGKVLDSKTLKEIEKLNNSSSLLKYAFSLLKKKHYSEWKMREKLYNKEAQKSDVDYVIKILKNNDLINDKMLVLDTISYGNERNIGKNKIMQDLANKGVFKENLNNYHFSDSNERRKAHNNLEKLSKKYDKYPYEQKKQHIYRALIGLGFDNDIALSVANEVKPGNNKEENLKLDRDYKNAYLRLSRKYEGRELKEKLISSLRNKGYKLNDILRKWEKNYGENDF